MALSVVYLFQTTICYAMLDVSVFNELARSESDYGEELYGMVKNVCLINIVHALTLLSLALFVVLFTRKFRILNESHYMQLGVLSMALTVVYLLPIGYIGYHAYVDARDS
mmetsp:Transcript_33356/g.43938  ORF Transcript_33356/g.43938 Transcript_33356/m.43938 type:complete len:110 (+) Transcript_33356:299-628(+)